MALADDLERIAALAAAHAKPGEELAGILAAEPGAGSRVYLCVFGTGDGRRSWLALDDAGEAIEERARVREAVSISALCEVAAEVAGGGDLEDLRSQLVAVRLRERPPGIEQAEEAALALERTIGAPPRLATPAFLDEIGAATRRLEQALGQDGGSPFAEAMRQALGAVASLTAEVEGSSKRALV